MTIITVHVPDWFRFNKQTGKANSWFRLQSNLWNDPVFQSMRLEARAMLMIIFSQCSERDADTVVVNLESLASGLQARTDTTVKALHQLVALKYVRTVDSDGNDVQIDYKPTRKRVQSAVNPQSIGSESASNPQSIDIPKAPESLDQIPTTNERTNEQNQRTKTPLKLPPGYEAFGQRFEDQHPDTEKFRAWVRENKFYNPILDRKASQIMSGFPAGGFEQFQAWYWGFVKTSKIKDMENEAEMKDFATNAILTTSGVRTPAYERKNNG